MFSVGFPGLGIMGMMFSMYLIGYILGRRGRRPPTEGEIVKASRFMVADYLESQVHDSYEAGLARGLEEGYSKFNKTLVKAKSDAWDEGFNAGYEEATEDN